MSQRHQQDVVTNSNQQPGEEMSCLEFPVSFWSLHTAEPKATARKRFRLSDDVKGPTVKTTAAGVDLHHHPQDTVRASRT